MCLVSIWPLTLLLIVFLQVLEEHKKKVREKVKDKFNSLRKDPATIGQFSIDDLKYIMYAMKIEAIVNDVKLKEAIQHNILDRSFEDYVLEQKSETRET
jgi:hypothetical protein